ncbi:VanW family protein [Trueperella pecoris]|uniref:VanW family protein n=1 Tax=Trueperella pecoris TaxID=2733571 RepID=A0A7M1QTJ6_9ACTO|nr:VanW family protein [Trueperella pecoris]QOR45228.1 VanW family protein [Trueperella pecoris]QTG75132.1 VanW family protein [Trueperella pecoris]
MADNPNEDDNLVDAWRKRLADGGDSAHADEAQSSEEAEAASGSADEAEPADETAVWDEPIADQVADEPAADTAVWDEPAAPATQRLAPVTQDTVLAMPPAVPPVEVPQAETDAAHDRPAKKKRAWLWGAGALVLALGYVGAAYAYQDRIPANTSISGIQVGGVDKAEAREVLAAGLHEALTTPRQVVVLGDTRQETINPGNIALEVDYDKTFGELTCFSLDPRRLWAHISGAANIDAVLKADDQALGTEVSRLAKEFKQDPADATLTITEGKSQVQPAREGHAVDEGGARRAILDKWLAGDAPIQLPADSVEPSVSTDEMNTFASSQVEPLLSGPISITVKDALVELAPAQTGDMLSVKADAGKPMLVVDEAKLEQAVSEKAGEVLSVAKDATITIVNGAPKITPSTSGEAIDVVKMSQALMDLSKGSDRTIVADVTAKEPEFTTQKAQALGIKEVVSEITTPLTNDPVRTTNLVVGTRNVNNTLVKPGERFNLEEALGPIDEQHGFVSSGVVSNGFNSTALGGGLSQLSTNTFNVGYRAGMIDVAHQPHSKYFSRYPMGLESTLWSGQISMIWENNTPYGALVETWVAGGQVHTRLWSTHYWDVEVWQGKPFNYVQPETKTNKAHDCEPSPAGGPGFSVRVGRVVKLNGEVKEDSQYTWTYQPVHAVRCE